MAPKIKHILDEKRLVVTLGHVELFEELIEPCREIFDEAFSAGVYDIILDMSDAETMDSFFLAMLVLLYKEVSSHGGEVKLVGTNERLCDILDRVRFRKLFNVYPTMQDALQ